MYKSIIVLSAAFALSACSTQHNEDKSIGMANPASVYCQEQGGKTTIKKDKNGDYGVCVFKNGKQIEEWQFYRQNHK